VVAEKPVETRAVINELVRRINEDTRRIRALEQRLSRIDNSIGSLQENALTQLNDLKVRLEKISNGLVGVSEKLNLIENEILRINKELIKTATKTEVKQIESFIDLLNPIKSRFVTRDEAERMLDDKLVKRKG
jgi:predicted  nucleic acid-binding Zn-ribbon protein